MNRKINRSMHKGMALFLSLVLLFSVMVPAGIGAEPLPDSAALSVAGAAYDSGPPSVAEETYDTEPLPPAEEAAGLNILSVTADVYVPPTKWEDYAATSFAGGTGTAEDPYQIATAEQLAYLATLCNDTQVQDTANPDPAKPLYAQKAYLITATIDLSAHLWPRLTSSTSRKFTGSFDGGDHIVAGMVVEIASGSYASLLGYIQDAVVKNVHLRNAWINGYTASGGIAGRANNSVVENCTVTGTVKTTRADGGVAGIVGDGSGVDISRCAFRGVLEGRTASGITAANYAIIDQCFADAEFNVSNPSSYATRVNAIGRGSISNCYAAGTAESTEIFGRGRNIGINGSLGSDEKIENCYSTLAITGGNYIGGIAGTVSPYENSDALTPLIRGCVALNGMIAADGYRGSPGRGSQYVGRIAGGVASGTNAAGEVTHPRINTNYAYKGTQVYSRDDNGEGAILRLIGLPAADRVDTGSQGEDITSADIADGNWPVDWDRDIWRFEAGKLPTLKNISDQMPQPGEMPAHISAAGDADWHITAFATDGQRLELSLGCTEADVVALLPATLLCTKDGATPASIPDVTWACGNFDGNTLGEYTFTATLPEGYAVAAPPTVTVKVIVGYIVTFESNGGSVVEAIRTDSGSMIAAPAVTRTGFILDGWYKDSACTQPWDFAADTVTGSITLYAKWSIDGEPGYTAAQPGTQRVDVSGMGFGDASIVRVSQADGYTTYAVVAEQRIDFWGPAGAYVIVNSGMFMGPLRIGAFDQNAGNTPQEKSYKGTGTAEDPYAMLGGFYNKDGSAAISAPSVGATFRIWNLIAGYDTEGKTDLGAPYSILIEDRNATTGRLNASWFVDGSKLLPSDADGWFRSPGTYGVVLNPSNQIIAGSFSAHALYSGDYSGRLTAATGALEAVRGAEEKVLMYHTQTRDFPGPITHKLDVSNYFNEGDTVHINYLLGAANRSLYHATQVQAKATVGYMLALEPIYIKNNTSAVVTGGYITFDLYNGGYFELVKAEADVHQIKYVAEFATDGGGDKLYPGTVDPQVLVAGAKVARPADPVKEGFVFGGWYADEDCTSPFDFEEPLTRHVILYAKWTEDGGGDPGGDPGETCTVTFATGNDPDTGNPNAAVPVQSVENGGQATEPGFFDSGYGYLVLGWYTDSALTNEYNFNSAVTSDLTLYPKWMRFILKSDLKKDGGTGAENDPYLVHLANSRQSKIAWKALNEVAGKSEWWKVYITEDDKPDGNVRYAWVFNGVDIGQCNLAHPYYTDVALTQKQDGVEAKFIWRTALEGKAGVSIDVSDYFNNGSNVAISYVEGSCDGLVAHDDVESGTWVDSMHHPGNYYSGGAAVVKDGFVTLELTHGGTYLLEEIVPQFEARSADVTGMGFADASIVSISFGDGYTTYAVVTEQRIDFWGPAGGEYVIADSGYSVSDKKITAFDQNAGNTPQEKSYKGTGTGEDPYAMLGGFYTGDGSALTAAPSVSATFRIWNLMAGYDPDGKTDQGTPYSIMVEDRNTATGRLNASFFVDGSKLLPSNADGWYRSPGTYGVALNPSDQIIAGSFSAHTLYSGAYSGRLAAATGALQAVRGDGKRVLMFHTYTRDFAGPITHKLDVSRYFNEGDTVHINYLLGAANYSLYHAPAIRDQVSVDYMLALEPIYIKNNTSAVVTDGYITFDLLNGGYFELVKAQDDDQEIKYVAEFAPDGGAKLYPGTIYPQVLAAGAKVAKPADPVKEGYTFGGWYSDEEGTSVYDFNAPLTQNIVLYARWTEEGDGDDDDGEGGGGSGGGTVPSYTVTFVTGDDPDSGDPNATIAAQKVKSGNTARDPGFFDSGFGYLVLAWYTDSKLKNEYDFDNEVTADLTLYPKWMRYILKNDLKKDGGSGSENSPYRAHLANSRQSKIAWKALNEIAGHSEWWKVYVTEDNERNGTVRYAWVFNGRDIDTCDTAQPYYTDIALTKKSSDTVQAKFVWRTAIEGKVYVSINVSDYFAEGADAEISYVNGSCDGKVAHTDVETGEWVDSLHHPSTYYSGGTSKVKDGFVTLELTHGGTYLIKSTGVSTGGTGGSGTPSAPEEEKVSVYLNPEGEAKDGAAMVAVTDTEVDGAIDAAVEEKADEIVIAPRITGEAKSIRVELSKTAVQSIAGKTGAALTFKTDLAAVTIAHDTLAELAGKNGDRVIFTIEEVSEDTVKFEIRLNVQVLENLKGVKLSIPVTGAGDGMVAVLVKADGSEETIRKSLLDGDQLLALVGGAATVKISDKSKSFRDVDDSFWGKKAVDFAASHELFTGVSEREFGPNGAMTRGMLVTVLHRLENTPAGGNASFKDVDKNSWYAQAVAWAAENSIISGTEKGFEPEGKITREQLAAMLYRYAQYVGLDAGIKGDITGFGDAGQISDWAGDAMNWTVGAGLMNGKGDNLLDPKGQATRAEVATIAHRLIQKMVR